MGIQESNEAQIKRLEALKQRQINKIIITDNSDVISALE